MQNPGDIFLLQKNQSQGNKLLETQRQTQGNSVEKHDNINEKDDPSSFSNPMLSQSGVPGSLQ